VFTAARVLAGVWALLALTTLAAACDGSSQPEATPTPDASVVPPGTPSPSASATGTATAETPTPAATPTTTPIVLPSIVAGKPLTQLVPGPAVDFPDDLVMYVATSRCFACGFGPGDLWRIYRGRDGQLVADHTKPAGSVPVYAISTDGSTIIAGVCTGYCGGESQPSEDAAVRFLISGDGGITWQPIDGPPLLRSYVIFSGWFRGQVVATAIKYLPSGVVEGVDTYLLPSFTRLEPPPGLPPPAFDRYQFPGAFVAPDGGLLWDASRTSPPLLFDEKGAPASLGGLEAIIPGVEWRDQTYGQTGRLGISGVWFPILPRGNDPGRFFVSLDENGEPTAGFATSVDTVTFGARVSGTVWLGTATLPLAAGEQAPAGGQETIRAVLIDTKTGLMHPVKGLPWYPSPLPGSFSFPRLTITGKFWRVDAGSECLNVRQESSVSSAVLGCFASGVLLRERDVVAPSGWRAVAAPDGTPGFAASSYLR